jgi:DNA-binding XRE family transcriptional regulator
MDERPIFIRIVEGPPAEPDDNAAKIESIAGIQYPPKTKGNWLRLLTLAGFSQEQADSVFRELGLDGYKDAKEVPRNYVSVGGRCDDGKFIPIDEPLVLTQRILIGLEPLRRKRDVSQPVSVVEGKTEKVEVRALAYLIANKGRTLTKTEVAKAIGCHPKTLSKGDAPDFHAAFTASQDYGTPFSGTKSKDGEMEFKSREEAHDWIIDNQLGRRNLVPAGASYLRGLQYRNQKKQGERTDLTSPQNEEKSTTAEKLADKHGVSKATIERDAEFSKAVDTVEANVRGTK